MKKDEMRRKVEFEIDSIFKCIMDEIKARRTIHSYYSGMFYSSIRMAMLLDIISVDEFLFLQRCIDAAEKLAGINYCKM